MEVTKLWIITEIIHGQLQDVYLRRNECDAIDKLNELQSQMPLNAPYMAYDVQMRYKEVDE